MNSWEKPIAGEEEYEEWKAEERVLVGVELTDSQLLDLSTVLSTKGKQQQTFTLGMKMTQ